MSAWPRHADQRGAHYSGSFCLAQRATSLLLWFYMKRGIILTPLVQWQLKEHWRYLCFSVIFTYPLVVATGTQSIHEVPGENIWVSLCVAILEAEFKTLLQHSGLGEICTLVSLYEEPILFCGLFLPFCTLYNLQVSVGDLKPWIPGSSVDQCYSAADWASLTPPYWRTSLIHNSTLCKIQEDASDAQTWYKLKSCVLFGPLQWFQSKKKQTTTKNQHQQKSLILQS